MAFILLGLSESTSGRPLELSDSYADVHLGSEFATDRITLRVYNGSLSAAVVTLKTADTEEVALPSVGAGEWSDEFELTLEGATLLEAISDVAADVFLVANVVRDLRYARHGKLVR